EGGALSEEDNPGLLEKADGGTIFLRHVDHLSLSAQVELLRTLEESLVYRVGSTTPRPSNFRCICSTSIDLWAMVQEGQFREDLYLRLAEVTLAMPPLRDTKDDIPRLARHFLARAAHERGQSPPDLDTASIECMRAYPWPGNVGELKNLCDRLVMFTRGEKIVLDDLSTDLRLAPNAFQYLGEERDAQLLDVEKTIIRRALARANGTVGLAADILGLQENQLKELIARYNIIMG
ncbi:MAG: sigma 54-interacting transcriptional regulator, partial [Thermodesulfobacteriota bacterium]